MGSPFLPAAQFATNSFNHRVRMRGVLLLVPLLGSASALPQGGFLSGIGNAFNNFFGGNDQGARPPPRQAQRPRPQPPRFQQQLQQQPQQQFQPQPQQQFQQQQQFQPQPPRQPAPSFNPRPTAAPAPPRLVGGTSLCGAAAPNHFWTDPRDNIQRGYVATWKIGCTSFQQHEAKAYCESMGMEPVSLDTPAKQDNFNRLIAQDAQRYFWTGGEVDHANEIVSWNNRNAKPIRFSESAHWSHTGGADLPQPDNRAAGENPPHPEVCLGILNNFYADGIKWHDVACHHKKPTVCEPRN